MLGHRQFDLHDYLEILRRRYWLIAGSGVLFLACGLGLTRFLPSVFDSQTLVIVQQQRVPESYVKPVITEDLNLRLASMKEQILSRSRLEPIIQRFGLFEGQNVGMEDRIDLTRKAISIKPIAAGANKTPGFYIGFRASSARVAQLVCGEITSLFLSESLNAREQSAEGTTAFLSQQVATAKGNLDEQDARLAAFEQKYLGRLPGQEQTNLNTLQALTARLDAITQSISRTEQQETYIDTLLSQQSAATEPSGLTSAGSLEALNRQLKSLIEQKKELEALYTPDHPDLLALTRRIAELRKTINDANSVASRAESGSAKIAPADRDNATQTRTTSPETQQAAAQLKVIRQSLSDQKREQARVAGQIRNYEARLQATPAIEAEYKKVTRDHETALEFYNNLLAKMNESTMATDLERRQQGEQFLVLDSANLPDSPTFPNRLVFGAGGFLTGILLGLIVTAFLEYRDKTLRSEHDIRFFTQQPTLAVLSLFSDGSNETSGRKHPLMPDASATP
jgi:polysaccharide chain length determinant protein (PEP-CTERM system associated)